MEYGTSHFESKQAAVKYYSPYHYADVVDAVDRKIAEGEIHIGAPTVKPGEHLYLNHREGRYFIEDPGYVTMLKAEGWQVWMRNDSATKRPAQYCFVTDGTHIAYVQWGDSYQTKVSTVHKPNKQSGTGFGIAEEITPKTVREAMICIAPSWASRDLHSVRKYANWNEYHHANSFNEELFQV